VPREFLQVFLRIRSLAPKIITRYIHTYIYIYISYNYLYIYIYIERERERKKEDSSVENAYPATTRRSLDLRVFIFKWFDSSKSRSLGIESILSSWIPKEFPTTKLTLSSNGRFSFSISGRRDNSRNVRRARFARQERERERERERARKWHFNYEGWRSSRNSALPHQALISEIPSGDPRVGEGHDHRIIADVSDRCSEGLLLLPARLVFQASDPLRASRSSREFSYLEDRRALERDTHPDKGRAWNRWWPEVVASIVEKPAPSIPGRSRNGCIPSDPAVAMRVLPKERRKIKRWISARFTIYRSRMADFFEKLWKKSPRGETTRQRCCCERSRPVNLRALCSFPLHHHHPPLPPPRRRPGPRRKSRSRFSVFGRPRTIPQARVSIQNRGGVTWKFFSSHIAAANDGATGGKIQLRLQ